MASPARICHESSIPGSPERRAGWDSAWRWHGASWRHTAAGFARAAGAALELQCRSGCHWPRSTKNYNVHRKSVFLAAALLVILGAGAAATCQGIAFWHSLDLPHSPLENVRARMAPVTGRLARRVVLVILDGLR